MRHFYFLLSLLVLNSLVINAQVVLSPNKNIKVILISKKASDEKSFDMVYLSIQYKKGSGYFDVLPESPVLISNLPITSNLLENLNQLKYTTTIK